MKRSPDQPHDRSLPSKAKDRPAFQEKAESRSEAIEDFKARIGNPTYEYIDDFKLERRNKSVDENNKKHVIFFKLEQTGPGKLNKNLLLKEEGNVARGSKQKTTRDQSKHELDIVEAAKGLLSRASSLERAYVAATIFSEAGVLHDISALNWPPFPRLSEKKVAAAIARGAQRPWQKRHTFGYDLHTNVFEFVKKEYAEWIPGLTQESLKSSDIHLYKLFTESAADLGLPHWLDVPNEDDAELRQISNPVYRLLRILTGKVGRDQTQAGEATANAVFPTLSVEQVQAAIQHGKKKENQWLNRGDSRCNPFEWANDRYTKWIPGLTLASIRKADPTLWNEIQKLLTDARRGMAVVPDWFNIPSENDAAILREPDPVKNAALIARRERDRIAKASQRTRNKEGESTRPGRKRSGAHANPQIR